MLIRLERVTPYCPRFCPDVSLSAEQHSHTGGCWIPFWSFSLALPLSLPPVSIKRQILPTAHIVHQISLVVKGAFCAVRWRCRRVKGNTPLTPAATRQMHRTDGKKAPSRGKGKALLGVHLEYAQQAVCIFCAFDITLAYLFGQRYNIPCKLG